MLWNLIYEFFVKFIFGGYLTNSVGTLNNYNALAFASNYGGVNSWSYTNGIYIEIFGQRTSLGNYFSFIATIIVLILILLIISHFIKKAFNVFGRII